VIAFYDRVRPDAARLVVRRWRLNPAYVEAIERVTPPQPAKTAVNSKS
jgi:hypothetical protein